MSYKKKKNRTVSTILKTQMMKKNLLLLSDCLKSTLKVQHLNLPSKYFKHIFKKKAEHINNQNIKCFKIIMIRDFS